MPKSSQSPLPAPRRLIDLDNRQEVDAFPYGIEAALGIPGASEPHAVTQAPDFGSHIGTSRSRKKHHSLFRGTETRSHRYRGSETYTGDVPMTRLGGKVLGGFSMLEQDAYLTIDFKVENLADAVAQPRRLPITVAGRSRWWHPDALLDLKDEPPVFVEVKTIAALHPRRPKPGMSKKELDHLAYRNSRVELTRARVAGMRRAVTEMGAQFWLLTEHQIRIQPQLHNADLMWFAVTANLPPDCIAEAATALRRLPTYATVADLSELVPTLADSIVLVACVLDRQGYLRLDRGQFFSHQCRFLNTSSVVA